MNIDKRKLFQYNNVLWICFAVMGKTFFIFDTNILARPLQACFLLEVIEISGLGVFDNIIENKLNMLHTAYLAKVISTDGITAKIQPLGKSKAYGGEAQSQSPLSNVPIIHSARWKLRRKTLTYVSDAPGLSQSKSNTDILVPTAISAGDVVLCVCCERDITEAKKGNNTVPALGRHSMSNSVIVGIL